MGIWRAEHHSAAGRTPGTAKLPPAVGAKVRAFLDVVEKTFPDRAFMPPACSGCLGSAAHTPGAGPGIRGWLAVEARVERKALLMPDRIAGLVCFSEEDQIPAIRRHGARDQKTPMLPQQFVPEFLLASRRYTRTKSVGVWNHAAVHNVNLRRVVHGYCRERVGGVSSMPNPLCTATSRIAVAGSSE